MPKDKNPISPQAASFQGSKSSVSIFFRASFDQARMKRAVSRWLAGAIWSAVLIPPIFYLRFGEVGPLGWGLTVFLSACCLLTAAGFYFQHRPVYHTPVTVQNDWLCHLGTWWLVTCAFGPLFGWLLTSSFLLTQDNWRWLHLSRAILCVVLPVLTALSLLRYVRGKGAPVMLALLLGVTALPVWSGMGSLRELQLSFGDLIQIADKKTAGATSIAWLNVVKPTPASRQAELG